MKMTDRVLHKLRTELQSMIDKLKEELLLEIKPISENLEAFTEKLNIVKETACQALELAETNAREIQVIKDRLEEVQAQNVELQTRNKSLLEERIKDVERNVEDRTNRGLRKTLVIKGVQEVENETWSQTEELLAGVIADHVKGYDLERAKRSIERAHRSAPSSNPNKQGQRDIYAKFYDWKDSEFFKFQFIKANKANSKLKTYFEQKYGALTTARRGKALEVRKSLKAENKITSAYVAFPAKLMTKTTNSKSEKYHCHHDFSHIEIDLKARRMMKTAVK